MNMNKTRRRLLWLFWVPVALSVMAALLYESELLTPGDLAGRPSLEFLATMVMELLTIALIPTALRLFRWRPVAGRLSSGDPRALALWGSVRLLMLTLPLMADTLCYYLFVNTAFGYMALILLLCLAFVYPTADRCSYEISQHDNSSDEEADSSHRQL